MKPVLFEIPPWMLFVLTGLFFIILLIIQIRQNKKTGSSKNETLKSLLIMGGMFGVAFILEALFIKKPLEIPAYGLMIMIAFVVGTYLGIYRAKRWGIDPVHVVDSGLYAVIFGILGARLLFIIQYFDVYFWGTGYRENGEQYNKFLSVFKIWQGGLVFYGGLIAGTIVIVVLLIKKKQNLPLMADLYFPSVILGLGITRIGCFFNGCCFGKTTGFPWGITFPYGSHVHLKQLEDIKMFIIEHKDLFNPDVYARKIQRLENVLDYSRGFFSSEAVSILQQMKTQILSHDISIDAMGHNIQNLINVPLRDLPLPIHPSQLYSSLMAFVIFAFLLFLTKYRKFDGQIASLFGMIYAVNRFSIEFLRNDNATNLGLTISQWISIFLFAASAYFYIYLKKKGQYTSLPIPPPKQNKSQKNTKEI